jgi:hypothetical protein
VETITMPARIPNPYHPFISERERAFYRGIAGQIIRPWETLIAHGQQPSAAVQAQILDLVAAGIKASRDNRR